MKVSDGVSSNDRNGNYNSTLTITTSGLEVGTYIYECRVFLKYTRPNLASYPGYWPATAELQIGVLSILSFGVIILIETPDICSTLKHYIYTVLQSWPKLLGTLRMNSRVSRYVLLLTQVPKFSIPPPPLSNIERKHESKINIELGEGGSKINLLNMFPKIAKCPNNFGQDCSYNVVPYYAYHFQS